MSKIERYEFETYKPEHPRGMKRGTSIFYKFSIDNSNEVTPLDWYESYFKIGFTIKKSNGTSLDDGTEISIASGMHSMIRSFKVHYGGKNVYELNEAHMATNVKNVMDFSNEYVSGVGSALFMFPDGGTLEPLRGRNPGFNTRSLATNSSVESVGMLPLNRYGFFSTFKREICPPGKFTIEIEITDDTILLFSKADVADCKFKVLGISLIILKLEFVGNPFASIKSGETKFLAERVERSSRMNARGGRFEISVLIEKPRHVFIWALDAEDLESQHGNAFLLKITKLMSKAAVTTVGSEEDAQYEANLEKARLEIGTGIFYPEGHILPKSERISTYKNLLDYNGAFNDHSSAPFINLSRFSKGYGLIYFDLRRQEGNLKHGPLRLTLEYEYDKTPIDYYMFALILYEQKLKIVNKSGKPEIVV